MMLGGQQPEGTRCSRAGCGQAATDALLWRNPKIHDETRTKTWLACADHRDYLEEFLLARTFPLRIVAVADLPALPGPNDAGGAR